MATGMLQIGDWVRTDLPDLLWPVLVLGERGTDGIRGFVAWQGLVRDDLSGMNIQVVAQGLDGRLTSLDRLVEAGAPKVLLRRRASECGLIPDGVASALNSYEDRPAGWLVDGGPGLDEPAIDLLSRSIFGVIADGHKEALVKCISIWGAVQLGTFSAAADVIDLLKTYPTDPSTRSRADSIIRASWLASQGGDLVVEPGRFDASREWARSFWDFNGAETGCLRVRDVAAAGLQNDTVRVEAEKALVDQDWTMDSERLARRAMDLLASFSEAVERSRAHVFDPERQEVHVGLVFGVGRLLIATLEAPDFWSVELGSSVVRRLVEVRILLAWMETQDEAIFRRFKDYGAGKAKLYANIAEETPDKQRSSDWEEAVSELRRLSYNDESLDLRVVDTADSFAGVSLRAMAEQTGNLDLYRRAYYMASGVAHSEWWSVETHAMERCMNILHRGHLIPSLNLGLGGSLQLAESWVASLQEIIRRSVDYLQLDPEAVTAAFAWVNGEDDTGYSEGHTPSTAPNA